MNYFKYISSPVGQLQLIATEEALLAVLWEQDPIGRVKIEVGTDAPQSPILLEAEKQLQEYFEKKRTTFTLPLAFHGTDFQKKVWETLLTIPFGETRTYGWIAQQLGDRNAVRAVGAANGKNPLSIIAPCHRVIGTTGKLTGFAGGLATKAFLLQLEKAHYAPTLWD